MTSLSNQLTFLMRKNHGVTGSYPVIRVLSPRNFPLRGDLSVNYFWSLDGTCQKMGIYSAKGFGQRAEGFKKSKSEMYRLKNP